MYTPLPYQFSPDEIASLLARTVNLDLAAGPGGTRMSSDVETRFYLEEALRKHHPFNEYLNWAMASRKAVWSYCSVVAIYPGAQIQAHRDAPITGRRLHVPLQQNPGCWSFHEGVWQQLELGQTYWMDPALEHGAVNWGPTLRLNLLVDVQG